MATTITAQLLANIKARKFTSVGRMCSSPVDFQGWTPSGRWVAEDPATVAKIIEVWFSPGAGSQVTWSTESSTSRSATLEYEIVWKAPPDESERVLRQAWILGLKGEKITSARVYCAGLHTEFPDVDLEKQRRSKGLGGLKPAPQSPKVIAAKAS